MKSRALFEIQKDHERLINFSDEYMFVLRVLAFSNKIFRRS